MIDPIWAANELELRDKLIAELRAENAALQADNNTARSAITTLMDELQAQDELAALRADAARYRWLRSSDRMGEAGGPVVMQGQFLDYPLTGENLDAAIDAARGTP